MLYDKNKNGSFLETAQETIIDDQLILRTIQKNTVLPAVNGVESPYE